MRPADVYILNRGLLVQGLDLEVQPLWWDFGKIHGSRIENAFRNIDISEMLKPCIYASFDKEIFMNTYYMPVIVLGIGYTEVDKW